MKRELVSKFANLALAAKIMDESKDVVEDVVDAPLVGEPSPVQNLIREIYAVNPMTGLPSGDLTYYVSDSVDPQIKEFIKSNLLMDTSSAANISIPEGIDSDLAFDLQRSAGESLHDYVERLNNFKEINLKMIADARSVVSSPAVQNSSAE